MPTRWVRICVDEQVHERMKQASDADRRSLSNWIAVTCERALEASTAQEMSGDLEPAR